MTDLDPVEAPVETDAAPRKPASLWSQIQALCGRSRQNHEVRPTPPAPDVAAFDTSLSVNTLPELLSQHLPSVKVLP